MTAWRSNLYLLWLGQCISTAGLMVLVPLLPLYLSEIGGAHGPGDWLWTGLSLAAPAIMLGVAAPLWGRIGDRWGRKWMIARALCGLGLSMILMSLARSPLELFLCRLFQGACGGVVEAAAAYASAEAPPEQRGRSLGLLQSATAAGSLAGPLLGGLLVNVWGLRPLLLVAGLLTCCVSLAVACLLSERQQPATAEAPTLPIRGAFATLMQSRQSRDLVVAGLLAQAGAYGLVAIFAPHVQLLVADTSTTAGWVGALQAVTWGATLCGAPWWGRRNDRGSIEQSFALAACGCAISIACQAWTPHVTLLFPLRMVQGFCFSALLQSVYLRISQLAGERGQGVQIGVANSFLTFGQVLGSLLGALFAGVLDPQWAFALIAGSFALSAALAWRHDLPLAQSYKGVTQ